MGEEPVLEATSENTSTSLRLRIATLVVFAFLGLLLSTYMTAQSANAKKCIFCTIIAGEMPQTHIEHETDDYVIFKDIKPAASHHYLAVSKRHIESVKTLTTDDETLILNMEKGLKEFLPTMNIDVNDTLLGFHLPPFISVKHLHLHAIAPRSEMTFLNRLMFRPNSMWFRTVEETLNLVRENHN